MHVGSVGHWAIAPVTTGQSTSEPLTVEDLRGHLRLPSDTDDFLVAGKLRAAWRRVEGRTYVSMLRNQFDLWIDRFPCDGSPIRIPRRPLVTVDSVWSYDLEGSSSQFSSSGYFVDAASDPGRLCLVSGHTWPSATRWQLGGVIRFTAGYTSTPATAGAIPDPLIEAMRKLATELHENREGVSIGNSVNEPLPFGIDELIAEFLLPEVG